MDEGGGLRTKEAMLGTDGRQVFETRLAEMVWDIVWIVEDDEENGVLEANETLLSAEKELNCGFRGDTLVSHKGSEEAFLLLETYLF